MLQQTKDIAVYLFSAELADRTKAENKKRTAKLENTLQNWAIPYKKVIGSYKGQLETSFRVQAKFVHPKFLKSVIFDRFNQESVLRINKNKKGYLIFSNHSQENIGTLKSTSIKRAVNQLEAFTIYGNKAWYFSNE